MRSPTPSHIVSRHVTSAHPCFSASPNFPLLRLPEGQAFPSVHPPLPPFPALFCLSISLLLLSDFLTRIYSSILLSFFLLSAFPFLTSLPPFLPLSSPAFVLSFFLSPSLLFFFGGTEPSSGRSSPLSSRPATPTHPLTPKHFHIPGRS